MPAPELRLKIDTAEMSARVKRNRRILHGEHTVELEEMYPPEFMTKWTRFSSIDQLVENSPVDMSGDRSPDKLNPSERQLWEDYITKRTRFDSWRQMVDQAALEWTFAQLQAENPHQPNGAATVSASTASTKSPLKPKPKDEDDSSAHGMAASLSPWLFLERFTKKHHLPQDPTKWSEDDHHRFFAELRKRQISTDWQLQWFPESIALDPDPSIRIVDAEDRIWVIDRAAKRQKAAVALRWGRRTAPAAKPVVADDDPTNDQASLGQRREGAWPKPDLPENVEDRLSRAPATMAAETPEDLLRRFTKQRKLPEDPTAWPIEEHERFIKEYLKLRRVREVVPEWYPPDVALDPDAETETIGDDGRKWVKDRLAKNQYPATAFYWGQHTPFFRKSLLSEAMTHARRHMDELGQRAFRHVKVIATDVKMLRNDLQLIAQYPLDALHGASLGEWAAMSTVANTFTFGLFYSDIEKELWKEAGLDDTATQAASKFFASLSREMAISAASMGTSALARQGCRAAIYACPLFLLYEAHGAHQSAVAAQDAFAKGDLVSALTNAGFTILAIAGLKGSVPETAKLLREQARNAGEAAKRAVDDIAKGNTLGSGLGGFGDFGSSRKPKMAPDKGGGAGGKPNDLNTDGNVNNSTDGVPDGAATANDVDGNAPPATAAEGGTASQKDPRTIFRGDKSFRGGDIGFPLDSAEAAAADIQDMAHHVLKKKTGQTSRWTSFTAETNVAKAFAGKDRTGRITKAAMAKLRELEAKGQIRIYDRDQVRDILLQDASKWVRDNAQNTWYLMKANQEFLVEGAVPSEILQKFK